MAALASYYVPDFELALSGQPLPAVLRAAVTSVSLEQALEGSDRVEVQFANPGLALLDHPSLQLKVPLELALGYQPGGLVDVFTGDITAIEPNFPASGMPTLGVSAQDHLHRLSESSKERGFAYYLTDAVIAAIVAGEHQLVAVPDPAAAVASGIAAAAKRPRWQYKQSDYDFLRAIAAEYGFDMWVDGDLFNFKLLIRQLPPATVELKWGESLMDFTPRLSSIGDVAAVAIKVWVEALKTQLSVEVSWDGSSVSVRIDTETSAPKQKAVARLSLPDVPLDSPADAVKWALGEIRRRINTIVTARGSALGDPRLHAGDTIALSGLGTRFSGTNYRLTSVTHTLDSGGYRSSFDVRQELI
jgi:phage protein D